MRNETPDRDADDRQWIDHPSGFLALSGDNLRWRAPGLPGFIAYREYGRHLVSFGGVHGPADARGPLLDSLLAHAVARGCRLLAVQVRSHQVPLFADRGFTVNRFGTSYGVTLAGYSFRGTPKMKLRNKIKRAQAVLQVVEVGAELPRTAATFAALESISRTWLAKKKKKEIEFMVGQLGGPDDHERRIFVAQDAASRLVGFVTYVPVWGRHPGYLHDLTRKHPDAPVGTMELINSVALERLRGEGVGHLHFGFTPFIADGEEPASASRLMSRAVSVLARYGSAVYPAQTQARYKLKWGPDLIETEYLAGKPLSPRAVIDLLLLTRSL